MNSINWQDVLAVFLVLAVFGPVIWFVARPQSTAPHFPPPPTLAEENSPRQQIANALEVASMYGGIDGAHHKEWVIDQMVRCLTGGDYEQWVKAQKTGEDGPDTYGWSEGIAP